MNCYWGIDIGGTTVKTALMGENGNILSTDSFATDSASGLDVLLVTLEMSIRRMLDNIPSARLRSVGIGCTGTVNIDKGIIGNPFTLPGLEHSCITKPLADLLHVPVFLDSDANTAHLAEIDFLEEDDPGDTILLSIGNGVSASVRVNHKLFRFPGETHPGIGHTSCGVESDAVCYCGKTNCMENIISGTALNRDAERFFGCLPEMVVDCCDTPMKKLFRENILRGLFNSVTTLSGIFNSKLVIIAGGMAEFYDRFFLDDLRENLSCLETEISPIPEVATAKLGKDSGRIGAAILAMERLREMKK